jgi:hypothetical protein
VNGGRGGQGRRFRGRGKKNHRSDVKQGKKNIPFESDDGFLLARPKQENAR